MLNKSFRYFFAAFALVAATVGIASAAPVEVRIATLAPDGSSWMKILTKASTEIATKTEQRVTFKHYAGGVQGDEREVVRKINLGQLDGAALTSAGLSLIDASIRVLELPRMFATVEELDYVADAMWPYFQKKFEAKGYKLLDRGGDGWIRFMSKNEVKAIADLKGIKVGQWGDAGMAPAIDKKLGVSGVALGVAEVGPALTDGRINACYSSPLAAVALGWNTKVNYMSSMPLSFDISATVIKRDVVMKMSADDKKAFEKLTKSATKVLRKEVRKDNENALKQMVRKGMTISATPADVVTQFDQAAADVRAELTGKMFSKAELDLVLKHRADYRAKNPVAATTAAAVATR